MKSMHEPTVRCVGLVPNQGFLFTWRSGMGRYPLVSASFGPTSPIITLGSDLWDRVIRIPGGEAPSEMLRLILDLNIRMLYYIHMRPVEQQGANFPIGAICDKPEMLAELTEMLFDWWSRRLGLHGVPRPVEFGLCAAMFRFTYDPVKSFEEAQAFINTPHRAVVRAGAHTTFFRFGCLHYYFSEDTPTGRVLLDAAHEGHDSWYNAAAIHADYCEEMGCTDQKLLGVLRSGMYPQPWSFGAW